MVHLSSALVVGSSAIQCVCTVIDTSSLIGPEKVSFAKLGVTHSNGFCQCSCSMTLLGALISFRFLTFLKVEVNLSHFPCNLGRADQECAYCGWHLVKPVTNLSAEQEQEKIKDDTPGCVMPSKDDWRKQPNLAALSCWLRRGYPGTALAPASASDTCGGET